MRGRMRGRNDPARNLTRLENSMRVTHERVLRHSGAAIRVTAAATAARRVLRWWGLLLLLLLLLRELRHGYAMTTVLYRRNGISVGLYGLRRELVLDHRQPSGRRRMVKRQPGQVDAGRNDALVVVRIDADQILFQIEGVLAVLFVLEFVLVKIRPTPKTSVNYVGKSFTRRHLETAVQRPAERIADGEKLRIMDTINEDTRRIHLYRQEQSRHLPFSLSRKGRIMD